MRSYCMGDFGEMGTKMSPPSSYKKYLYRKMTDGSGEIYAISSSVGRSMPKVSNIKPVKISVATMKKYGSEPIPQGLLANLVNSASKSFLSNIFSPASNVLNAAGQFAINAGNMALDTVKPTFNQIQNYHIKPAQVKLPVNQPIAAPLTTTQLPIKKTVVLNSSNPVKVPDINISEPKKMSTIAMAGTAVAILGVGFLLMGKEA